MAPRKDPKRKIIEAALTLAADNPWQDLKLADIAAKARIPFGEMRNLFDSRTAILNGFIRDLDREILDHPDDDAATSDARDRIFDIVMRRLEMLQPHKAAVRNIVAAVRGNPAIWPRIAGTALGSQRWMLAGVGLEPRGLRGEIRVRGLAMVYWSVLNIWLDDEDPGMARTMSALDRQLRRGEAWLKRVDGPAMLLGGLGALARAALCRVSGPSRSPATGQTAE